MPQAMHGDSGSIVRVCQVDYRFSDWLNHFLDKSRFKEMVLMNSTQINYHNTNGIILISSVGLRYFPYNQEWKVFQILRTRVTQEQLKRRARGHWHDKEQCALVTIIPGLPAFNKVECLTSDMQMQPERNQELSTLIQPCPASRHDAWQVVPGSGKGARGSSEVPSLCFRFLIQREEEAHELLRGTAE